MGFLPFFFFRFRLFFGLGATVLVVVVGVVMGVVVGGALVVAVVAVVVVLVVVVVVVVLLFLVLVAPFWVWLLVSCVVAVALSGGATSSQCLAHALRHCAKATSCSKVAVSGASMQILPGSPSSHCMRTANFTRRSPSPVSSSLRMWPNHWCLLFRIAATMSYVLFFALASSCDDRPVNLDRHLAFAPLMAERVFTSSCQASLPYVSSDVTADL